MQTVDSEARNDVLRWKELQDILQIKTAVPDGCVWDPGKTVRPLTKEHATWAPPVGAGHDSIASGHCMETPTPDASGSAIFQTNSPSDFFNCAKFPTHESHQ